MEFTPGFAVFLGGMVAAIVLFAAGLTYLVAPSQVVRGFAAGLAALAAAVFALGLVVAAAVAVHRRA